MRAHTQLGRVTAGLVAMLGIGCGTGSAGPSAATSNGEALRFRDDGLLAVGERAPSFLLKDQSGRRRKLEDFRGSWIVLYFYPMDGTFGCTREARAFRDAYPKLRARNARVVGVSTDGTSSHAAFAQEENLPFTLLTDPDGAVAEAFGVGGLFGFTSRKTFLIDPRGYVRRVFGDVSPAEHAEEVLDALQELHHRRGVPPVRPSQAERATVILQ